MDAVFFATLIGSALGVVAGAFVQYLAELFLERRALKERKRTLRKEFSYNVSLIDGIRDDIARARAMIGAGNMWDYMPVLNLGSGLHLVLDRMSVNGEIYVIFDNDEIKKLTSIRFFLSPGNFEWYSSEYAKNKSEQRPDKFLDLLNYVDEKCKSTRDDIVKLSTKLP